MGLKLEELTEEIMSAAHSAELDWLDIVVEGNVSDWDRPLTLPSPQRGEGSGLRLPLPRGERAGPSPAEAGATAREGGVRGVFAYVRLGGFEVGLLIGSHVPVLKQGLRRKVP